MGKFAQFVMGPAGCGKSTYCARMQEHCAAIKRVVHLVNLDPAAEDPLCYSPSIDIRELVRADEVAEQLSFGPNGALMYAVQYLVDNIDWLLDRVGDYDDDYLIIDCPGQLELYSHIPVMRALVDALQNQAGYRIVGLYLIDAHFLADPAKFVSGVLACLSAMTRMELPHLNVLSKMDLVRTALPLARFNTRKTKQFFRKSHLSKGFFTDDPKDIEFAAAARDGDPGDDSVAAAAAAADAREGNDDDSDADDDGPLEGAEEDDEELQDTLERYCDVDVQYILTRLQRHTGPAFTKLNQAIGQLLEEYSMVTFIPLNLNKKGSVDALLRECDVAIQYGEDEEPRDPGDADADADAPFGGDDSGLPQMPEAADLPAGLQDVLAAND